MEPNSKRSTVFLTITVIILVALCMVLVTDIMFMSHTPARNLLTVYLIASSLLSFHKSAMKDPGCLSSCANQCFDIRPLNLKGGMQIVPDPLNNTRKIIFPGDCVYVQKYCLTCNIFRPMRTSHCSECGGCILERDHHCVWLDNCIGRNNIKHFFCFVISLALLTYHSIYSLGTLKDYVPYYFYLVAVFVFGILSVCVSLLVLYNVFLALLDISSKEFLSSNWSNLPKISPRGIVKRLCTIRPYIITRQDDV